MSTLLKYFSIPSQNQKTSLGKEIISGFTTFFTMAYVVLVNPSLWGTSGTGVDISMALTATVLSAFVATLLAGFVIRLPYALAPGMGLNVFVVYSLILSDHIPWQIALGIVFWSSLIFLLISLCPIRQKIVEALPLQMKHALSCGIGLFLALIGFRNLHLVVPDPNTLVTMGTLDGKIGLGFLGFFIALYLFIKNKSYSFLASIMIVTGASVALGYTKIPTHLWACPHFSQVFFQMDLVGSFKLSFLPALIAVLLTGLFDSIASLIALSQIAQFSDGQGNPWRLKQALIVDSVSSVLACLFGTSPTAIYIESATGIRAGGRTGFASVVCALCFLPCLFAAPLVALVPAYATAPILIFVGILMVQVLKEIKYSEFYELIPIFFTIALMPLTFSITRGVIFGIISYVLTRIIANKVREISWALWSIFALCVGGLIL